MEITTFQPQYLPEMAALFVRNYKALRQSVPILPDLMAQPERVETMLRDRLAGCPGVVALENGVVAGFIGWFIVDHFRGTERRGAYVPEWGHAAADPITYRAMYRAAAQSWREAGCGVHCISLLAHDEAAVKTWFWSGFGMILVDAIRPIDPLGIPLPTDITIRKATPADLDVLCALEIEHGQHYTEPPIQMAAYEPQEAAALAAFMDEPGNSLWLALDGDAVMGYMRFESNSHGASAIVNAPDKVANTGAFVRPAYRGRRAAPALLDAALRDYAAQGCARCSVDFESFNPEAANFWLRYFDPVTFSLMRVPESI
ncbi:MAG: GNAT family N-acetyltransferase [Anaerolineae bacterium]|nr:GNAT family N-acetyltransferase [Anaerolineae bacterium]